jgi:hypothetical protein
MTISDLLEQPCNMSDDITTLKKLFKTYWQLGTNSHNFLPASWQTCYSMWDFFASTGRYENSLMRVGKREFPREFPCPVETRTWALSAQTWIFVSVSMETLATRPLCRLSIWSRVIIVLYIINRTRVKNVFALLFVDKSRTSCYIL